MWRGPIIFSGPMVQAIRRGDKTQTRRLLYTPRKGRAGAMPKNCAIVHFDGTAYPPAYKMPDGRDIVQPDWAWGTTGWHKRRAGDLLWVRENFMSVPYVPGKPACWPSGTAVWYPADGLSPYDGSHGAMRPSIHMPAKLSRLTLRLRRVRIERLQAISDDDVLAEGLLEAMRSPQYFDKQGAGDKWMREAIIATCGSLRDGFREIWVRINGTPSWDMNPFVVALTFEPIPQNINTIREGT